MMANTPKVLIAIFALSSLPATVLAEDPVPELTTEGLELVEKDRRGEIYADPDIDWSVYTEIILDRPSVAFRKNWQRDQNRQRPFKIRSEDMDRIKNGLADQFEEVFSEELSGDGGYTMAQEAADHVLRITPHIVDLDVYAPDSKSAGRTYSYTESAGRMTLKLAMYDSVTGDLIATASDRQESPRRGYMQWTTSVSNSAESRRMLERWATDLRERLDESRASGKQ